MSDYEKMHEQCTESLEDQWLEYTAHGKLFRILEDYECTASDRYSRVVNRLLQRRNDYVEEHWDEEWAELVDAEEEAADPYRYRGLSRRDF